MSGSVLIVVDVQNDFLLGGPLAVPEGDAVIAPINALAECFDHVVVTQDWHPPGHVSFASTHKGRKPLDRLRLADGREQVLWPEHCLQGSPGAALAAALQLDKAELVIRKGWRAGLDSYSAFLEADGAPTGRRTTRAGCCSIGCSSTSIAASVPASRRKRWNMSGIDSVDSRGTLRIVAITTRSWARPSARTA